MKSWRDEKSPQLDVWWYLQKMTLKIVMLCGVGKSRALTCNCSHVHLAISIFLVVFIIHSSLIGHTVCYFNTTNLYQSLLDNHIYTKKTRYSNKKIKK